MFAIVAGLHCELGTAPGGDRHPQRSIAAVGQEGIGAESDGGGTDYQERQRALERASDEGFGETQGHPGKVSYPWGQSQSQVWQAGLWDHSLHVEYVILSGPILYMDMIQKA